MRIRTSVLALFALFVAADVRAQAAWDAPSFMPPRPGDDIGIYLSDVADFKIEGIWRQRGNLNLGLRLGYIDGWGDGAITVGAETWDLIAVADQTLPVDVAWTLGAGAAFNGGTVLEIPAGLSIGRTLDLNGLDLQVYGHPRLGLFVYSVADETEIDIDGLFGLGADAILNENLKLRVGATLGGADAIGLGLAWRWSRGAVVR